MRLPSEYREKGSVRASYVPVGSQFPPSYRCQPELALGDPAQTKNATAEQIRQRLTPAFTSTEYGQPGYAQLSQTCAEEIRSGAEDHSEMGAFQRLYQPQHAANLRRHLAEYVPVGQKVEIHYET